VLHQLSTQPLPPERARQSLYEFVKQAWHFIEPDTPFKDGWHIRVVCAHLEAIVLGDIPSIVINVPPGTMKSILSSVCLCPWAWLTNPSLRFLHASYSQSLALRDSVKARNIVRSDWYQGLCGALGVNVELTRGQDQKSRFDTTQSGWRFSTSVGGTATGEHPDVIVCFPPGTRIATPSGYRAIEDVSNGDEVLSHGTKCGLSSRQVVRVFDNPYCGVMWEVNGVEMTPNHPVLVRGRGYVRADSIRIGDQVASYVSLRNMRRVVSCDASQSKERGESLLLEKVPIPRDEREAAPCVDRREADVSQLWGSDHNGVGRKNEDGEILLAQMPDGNDQKSGREEPRLSAAISPRLAEESGMLSVRLTKREDRATPHQPRPNGWQGVEQDAGLQSVSCQNPSTGRRSVVWRAVLSSGPSRFFDGRVHNFEVEGTHTYIANDLIVHNCDDAHSAAQAQSDKERQAAIDWWDGTMTTRGRSRGCRRAIVGQRLHEQDLPGHLIGQGWANLVLPMRYEQEQHAQTPLGDCDIRSEEGELLCPSLFSAEAVDSLEKELGTHRAAGQLQQRPTALDGEIFKREWFGRTIKHAPSDGRFVRYCDKAGTPGSGAYTAMVLMCEKDGTYYICDVVRGQWSPNDRNAVIRQVAAADSAAYRDYMFGHEREPGSAGVESSQITSRELAGIRVKEDRVTGDKVSRSLNFAAQCEAGNVVLVEGEWNHELISELLGFPNAQYKDQVDACSGGFGLLVTERSTVANQLMLDDVTLEISPLDWVEYD